MQIIFILQKTYLQLKDLLVYYTTSHRGADEWTTHNLHCYKKNNDTRNGQIGRITVKRESAMVPSSQMCDKNMIYLPNISALTFGWLALTFLGNNYFEDLQFTLYMKIFCDFALFLRQSKNLEIKRQNGKKYNNEYILSIDYLG